MIRKPTKDRRVKRTRAALLSAFNELALEERKREIRVADVVERAHVGRSTFYEHYAGADDIHMHALAGPLSILADAIVGKADATRLVRLLGHFWENRQRAQLTFALPAGAQVGQLLASMVAQRLPRPNSVTTRLAAVQLAEGKLAAIRCWIAGDIECTAEELAAAISGSSGVGSGR